jgi:hypothetical protein
MYANRQSGRIVLSGHLRGETGERAPTAARSVPRSKTRLAQVLNPYTMPAGRLQWIDHDVMRIRLIGYCVADIQRRDAIGKSHFKGAFNSMASYAGGNALTLMSRNIASQRRALPCSSSTVPAVRIRSSIAPAMRSPCHRGGADKAIQSHTIASIQPPTTSVGQCAPR